MFPDGLAIQTVAKANALTPLNVAAQAVPMGRLVRQHAGRLMAKRLNREIKMYVPSNIKAFASTRETSDEIALAIFEAAKEGDEARMWTDPTEEEIMQVITRAWQLADPEENTLHWGNETIRRQDA